MKTLFLIMIIISGCNVFQQHNMEGVYVNKAESEYSIAEDTIILRGANAGRFNIIRKIGFQRKKDGILFPKEYKTEYSGGIYDPLHQIIHENKKGLVVICDAEIIQINNTTFHKIQ
ncbi:hypothetical protein GALL_165710 [mine drainage metagenome]|uniref:Uncharacterized protein n=1 Tax=mine drainage metagenome TaxID=410659 RepID=A0A1J5S000_9ZZZZ